MSSQESQKYQLPSSPSDLRNMLQNLWHFLLGKRHVSSQKLPRRMPVTSTLNCRCCQQSVKWTNQQSSLQLQLLHHRNNLRFGFGSWYANRCRTFMEYKFHISSHHQSRASGEDTNSLDTMSVYFSVHHWDNLGFLPLTWGGRCMNTCNEPLWNKCFTSLMTSF